MFIKVERTVLSDKGFSDGDVSECEQLDGRNAA
jgi:hypothetical protein